MRDNAYKITLTAVAVRARSQPPPPARPEVPNER
jgi:hypothetical protein